MSRIRSRCQGVLANMTRQEPGQVVVLFAVFVIVLMVLAGSAYDYASIVVDDARLQNAVDAAALAGANSLSRSAGDANPTATAETVTRDYLARNGVATQTPGTNVQITFPTSTPVGANPPSTVKENLGLQVARQHQNAFWPLVGINQVTMHDGGGAHAARAMTDIVVSLDTTASMYLAGLISSPKRNDFQSLRSAVDAFIDQVNPATTDTRGPQIALARFAGIKCNWQRNGDGDQNIDVRPQPTPSPQEYNTGCTDDMTVLSPLTSDRAALKQIANADGGVPCPTTTTTSIACPLQHLWYTAPQTNGTPTTINGITDSSGTTTQCYQPTNIDYQATPAIHFAAVACSPGYTGTKLPNGINVTTSTSYGYLWSEANGGRNDQHGEGNARKVLVLMTDGQDEAWPAEGPQANPGQWDADFDAAAATLKLGPDGIAGTQDDVEVYTVGFFCTPYQGGSSWCQSQVAETSPKQCPGPNWGSITASDIDTKLRNASSSTPGTCDHYFPLAKTDSLPALFQQLAGTISRGQLTN